MNCVWILILKNERKKEKNIVYLVWKFCWAFSVTVRLKTWKYSLFPQIQVMGNHGLSVGILSTTSVRFQIWRLTHFRLRRASSAPSSFITTHQWVLVERGAMDVWGWAIPTTSPSPWSWCLSPSMEWRKSPPPRALMDTRWHCRWKERSSLGEMVSRSAA